ncbi:GNAT family N-acetyltransferase [Aquimarina pacifica]|uniref:GNAT family N-acetyltransferase n=1 Tax=Aquimarina pacifica TaxID=1296415 RepID=UPI0004726065|nr:GNAT family N-acetyltransferase [Aquimarina pacifica]
MQHLTVKLLQKEELDDIISLTQHLNPNREISTLKKRHLEMFAFDNYQCFGLFEKAQLIGVSSSWMTVRLYSGKQLEVDNVIIDPTIHSKGYGAFFLNYIENWAKEQGCESVELNTYVQNSKSHKFYFRQGYIILGYHFQKVL